jgi:superfamily II DNA or RNA helicase
VPGLQFEKGEQMNLKLRPFQADIDVALKEIAAGISKAKKFICDITTGGGKSIIPVLICNRLIASSVDRVCWVAPRRSLAIAGTRTMAAHGIELMHGQNDIRPARGTKGYACTYDLIAANPELHAHEFETARYALVLDEPHHIACPRPGQSLDGYVWYRSIKPLVERAGFVVLMTGTMERGDKNPIAFIDYGPHGLPDRKDTGETRHFSYPRTQALADGNIVPVEFHHLDSAGTYIDQNGMRCDYSTLKIEDESCSRDALFTAVKEDYGRALLEKGCLHYLHMRQRELGYANSQLLIVAMNVQQARYMAKLAKEVTGLNCECVTGDTPDQDAIIQRFKENKTPILSSCQMAYEGLDAPAVSHVISLTLIRSKPWIEQMIGRAVRRHPGKTKAYVFCPDDTLMCEVIEQISQEQTSALRIVGERNQGSGIGQSANLGASIVPVASVATTGRITGLDCGTEVTADELAYIQQRCPDMLHIATNLKQWNTMHGIEMPSVKPDNVASVVVTPDDIIEKVRAALQTACNKKDLLMGWPHGTANAKVKKEFGKGRGQMDEKETRQAFKWVCRTWPEALPKSNAYQAA